jgi:methyl-accepting chemotaxis protein
VSLHGLAVPAQENGMFASWPIGRKLAAGFAVVTMLTLMGTLAGIFAVRAVIADKDRVIGTDWERRLLVEEMRVTREQRAKAVRSYLITKDEKFVTEVARYRNEMISAAAHFEETGASPRERELVDAVARANQEMQAAWDALIARRRAGLAPEEMTEIFERDQRIVKDLNDALAALAAYETDRLRANSQAANVVGSRAQSGLLVLLLVAVAAAALFSWALSRDLVREVGLATHNVQSSSTELQAAATQQSASSRELAATTGEVSTTMRELLATSRQIAESAQRVVQIALETAGVAKSADATGQRAHEAIVAIRQQVDVIVGHMVDLGRKSQQIGAILDLINELAEQTNILSINATIEAAGAGEGGRRFAVVANEVRRLADRVAGSAREIRALVEEIQAAANTTVMATEDGRKAVDAGGRQFGDVLSAFERITQRVTATTEAAREIELSTKQQTTAVEQVNLAIADVAHAAKESEASTAQTLATAGQLATVSTRLAGLIRASTSA